MSKITKAVTINLCFYGISKNICEIHDSLCCLVVDEDTLHPLTTLVNIHDMTACGVYMFCNNVLKILNLEGIFDSSEDIKDMPIFENGLLYDTESDIYTRLSSIDILQAYRLTIIKLKESAASCITEGIVFQYDNKKLSDHGLKIQDEFDNKIVQEKKGILYEQSKLINSLIKRNRVRDRNRRRRK